MNIGILASGNLGLYVLKEVQHAIEPVFIATDSGSRTIIQYATEKGIPVFKGNPRGGRLYTFATDFKIDVLLSINYLFLIEKDLIGLPSKYAINFHGSLLPKYRGRTPHVWAIINNEPYTGITAHLIDENCDTGAILLQEKVKIDESDTGADLLDKYKQIYPKMVIDLLKKLQDQMLQPQIQEEAQATYFGKRTPEDGEINWDWQKEQIYNWVRAQAYPYPGAYTYLDGQKITIDKVEYTNGGYHFDQPNGSILTDGEQPVVKTPNGAVKLVSIREEIDFTDCKNKILGQ
ncbi:methionyl-tRNA formyltransferase [Rapidithrix thailandica]|uniref:Methionyl-tRNA formyltransferase n=1 Tax=Rapidithrix thailandica TaxID=413964 RepID=A0AAW9SA43_9BACT